MIGLIFFLVLGALFVVLSMATSKANKHGLTVFFVTLSATCAIASVFVYPISESITAQIILEIETSRAKAMIGELGSPELYIQYLESIR